MATQRRYTKAQKVNAVVAAVASSTLAAAEQAGVPESTLRYWMNDPEFAEIREKAGAELAPLATVAAFMGWVETIRLLREHKLDPRDVIFLTGLATDKSQLLGGQATHRIESKDITDVFDDHETRAIVTAAREYLEGAGSAEGTEVVEAAAVEDAGS